MKKNITNQSTSETKITRKQAIKKAGMLSFTTAAMIVLLKSPAQASASAPTPPPEW